MREYYSIEIPDEFRIFEQEFRLAGIQHYKVDFLKLIKKRNEIHYHLEPQPDNPKDKNALQVRGVRDKVFGKLNVCIGYIPADIASHISDAKIVSELILRPKRFYINAQEEIEFTFDLLGPKTLYEKYQTV